MRANAVGPPRASVSVKTGMMAVDSAPSARSRRSRFGIRKATKNASVSGVAPKARASTMSRAYPRIRLPSVARPMVPTARTTPVRTPGSASLTRTNSLTAPDPDGNVVCRADAHLQEASARGQYPIRDQADEAEREAPPAESCGPREHPFDREGRPRRHGGPGGRGVHPPRDPHARSGGDPGPDAPQHRRSQEVRARQEAQRPRLIRTAGPPLFPR